MHDYISKLVTDSGWFGFAVAASLLPPSAVGLRFGVLVADSWRPIWTPPTLLEGPSNPYLEGPKGCLEHLGD